MLSIEGYRHEDIDLLKSIRVSPQLLPKTIYAAVSTTSGFKRAKQLTSYCGLVPTVRSSGERADYGHITREGRSEVRQMAVQSAHAVLTMQDHRKLPLREVACAGSEATRI